MDQPTTSHDDRQAPARDGPARGWFRVPNAAIDEYLRNVPPSAFAVYLILRRFADWHSGKCYPSLRTVATLANMSRRNVQVNIAKLVRAGMIQVEKSEGGRGAHATHTFSILELTPHGKDEADFTPQSVPVQPIAPLGVQPAARLGVQLRAQEQDHRNKTIGTRPRRTRRTACAVEIPAPLDTPQFRDKWAEWLAYRSRRRLSKDSACLNRQLTMLATLGVDGAIQSIEASLRNGWQGLFPPKEHENGHAKHDALIRGKYDPNRPVTPL